jgi:tetratricopeptide (TPR) repeat protein
MIGRLPAIWNRLLVHRAVVGCGMCLLMALGSSIALAQDERLIDSEPYDELTLDAENGNAVLKVLPLDFPNRVVPRQPNPDSNLRLRLFDRPQRLYECAWRHIVRVRLYEQMILTEAESLAAKGNFNEAFEFYEFLQRNYAKTPQLNESFDGFLYKNALAEAKLQNFEGAFPLLYELAERNPQYPNLDRALEAVGTRVIEQRLADERFASARAAIALVRKKFADTPLPKVERLRAQLMGEATKLRDAAQQNLASNQLRAAQRAARQAITVWPDLEGLAALNRQIDAKYPLVFAGVLQSSATATGGLLDDWASRRTARMLVRQPVELIGFSVDGGIYRSPLGGISRDDTGLRWSIQLRSNIPLDNDQQLTGHDLARVLLTQQPANVANRQWQAALQSVAVNQVFSVRMTMNRALVRPERLLEAADVFATPWPGKNLPPAPPWVRPYYVPSEGQTGGAEMRYLVEPAYFANTNLMPQEVVEVHFPDPDDAVSALRRGEIDVLDRVPPWAVASLANQPEIVVDRYLIPTVHALLPHPKSKPAANRNLRRAILYGLARQAILDRALLGGRTEPGSQVVSGPFVAGASFDDAMGYGSNPNIVPVPWEPRMAIALLAIATKELEPADDEPAAAQPSETADDKKSEDDAEEDESSLPKPVAKSLRLVIAHPPEPIAALACASIVGQLGMIGIEVELLPLTGAATDEPPTYDFRYAELAAWEPAVDARRLLGEDGVVGACSPYLSIALAKLDAAQNWREVRERLAEVHRLVAGEMTIIPLWQTVNHFAYRRGSAEVGAQPVSLYQYIETWKHSAELAAKP